MKFRRVKRASLSGRKVNTVFKTWRGTPQELKKLRKPKLTLASDDACCSDWLKSRPRDTRYMVMGKRGGGNGDGEMTATFILPWTKSDAIRRARRMFKRIDCDNLVQTSQRMMAEALAAAPHSAVFSVDRRNSANRGRRTSTRQKSRKKKETKI